MVWMPFEMPSSRPVSWLERSFSEAAVKKLTGLSIAELTFLPVARRFWICEDWAAVDCSVARLLRTPAERETAMFSIPSWYGAFWRRDRSGPDRGRMRPIS